MKNTTAGLGKYIFMEWLVPPIHYACTLQKPDAVFDMGIPAIGAVICAYWYHSIGKTTMALDALADLLPSAISILIGFTAIFISLLLTSETTAIKTLKTRETKAKINNKSVTAYQMLHIQLTESLFSQIMLLLVTFGYLFYKGIGYAAALEVIALGVEVYLTLHILLGIIRSMTNLYCVYYSADNSEK